MPFGLTNAPATFNKLMYRCLGDLHDGCLVYLDDIVVLSSSIPEHLEKLFQCLPSKCHFLKSELLYIGPVVSSRGVHTDPDKLTAVRTSPTPTKIKEKCNSLLASLDFIVVSSRILPKFLNLFTNFCEGMAETPKRIKQNLYFPYMSGVRTNRNILSHLNMS